MWIVAKTPRNYHPPGKEPWCIIDSEDGDIYEFYATEQDAVDAYKKEFNTEEVKRWEDVV